MRVVTKIRPRLPLCSLPSCHFELPLGSQLAPGPPLPKPGSPEGLPAPCCPCSGWGRWGAPSYRETCYGAWLLGICRLSQPGSASYLVAGCLMNNFSQLCSGPALMP